MLKNNKYLLLAFLCALTINCRAYSPLRKTIKPTLEVSLTTSSKKPCKLISSHLEITPLFKLYNEENFTTYVLPKTPIAGRHTKTEYDTQILRDLIENLILEVKENKKVYTDFIILKKRDFNKKEQSGLLIAKFKKYPFVVKLFIETPESFVKPFNKGFEAHCHFIVGGGINRHLLGFTRVKNALFIKNRLQKNSHWRKNADVPRKWFWLPNNPSYLQLTGYNIGGYDKIETKIPAVYAIVADYIDIKKTFSILNKRDRDTAIDLSNFLLCKIDPHIDNFIREAFTDKIVIIDTEHFPSMGGFKKRPKITHYTSWYLHLLFKYVNDRFCRTKKERRFIQSNPNVPFSLP